jgi:hypothetical protein
MAIETSATQQSRRPRHNPENNNPIDNGRENLHSNNNNYLIVPGDQEGLFKLAIQLRKFFNWVIYNTATGYVLLVYLTNI